MRRISDWKRTIIAIAEYRGERGKQRPQRFQMRPDGDLIDDDHRHDAREDVGRTCAADDLQQLVNDESDRENIQNRGDSQPWHRKCEFGREHDRLPLL